MIIGFAVWTVLIGCSGEAEEKSAGSEALPTGAVLSIGTVPAAILQAGGSTKVNVPVYIRDGYHVQANPASKEFLIPLDLQLEPADGLSWESPIYPAGRPYRLEGTVEDLMTYEGDVSIAVIIKAPVSASSGERIIKGTLHYQACDSSRCLFPAAVPVSIKVVIS